jgi:hypothetical protein
MDKNEAINTVYAFCRQTDDIIDNEADSHEVKYKKIRLWRGEFEKALLSYEELLKVQQGNSIYFQRIIDCHQQLLQFDKAEKAGISFTKTVGYDILDIQNKNIYRIRAKGRVYTIGDVASEDNSVEIRKFTQVLEEGGYTLKVKLNDTYYKLEELDTMSQAKKTFMDWLKELVV